MKSKFHIKCILLLSLFFTFHFLSAQPGEPRFTHITTDDGLSSSECTRVIQDREGFIWIGTSDGLNRYDGRSVKIYRKIAHDPTSLQNNNITALCIDHLGILWVGTDRGGLSRYNKEKDCFENFQNVAGDDHSLTDNKVTAIAEDGNHNLWVSTYRALHRYDYQLNHFTRYIDTNSRSSSSENTIAGNHIRALSVDDEGNLWIGYSDALISIFDLSTGNFTHKRFKTITEPEISDFMVNTICFDEDRVWVGTRGDGIWIYHPDNERWSRFDKLNELFINSIMKDSRGNIWIGGGHCGLVRYDKKKNSLVAYKHSDLDRNSISTDAIYHIFEDRQKNMWICNIQGNISYTTLTNSFYAVNDLKYNNITSVLENENTLWIGFYNVGGIETLNLLTRERKFLEPGGSSGLGKGTVHCIFRDSRSNIWVGTYLGGLQMFDSRSGKFVTYKHNPNDTLSISGNDIRKIDEDSEGNLWIAVHGGGTDKFDREKKTFKHFRAKLGDTNRYILNNWIFTVFCDRDDNVWVGSVDGISKISKDGKIKNYINHPNDTTSLSNNIVFSIFQDSHGRMWFGTDDGLNLLNEENGTFRYYTTKDGLANNKVTAITEDKNHNLWIATNKGISKFNKNFKNYYVNDGLVTDEFFHPGVAKNIGDKIYFGGRQGLIFFYPDSILINKEIPPVYFTGFKLFNQEVPIKGNKQIFHLDTFISFTREITLKYHQNVLTFSFVALNYNQPLKNQYSYIMEGFDKKWNPIGSRNEVTYTNLTPGEYTLIVKASNNDEVWNEKGAKLKIYINPPWWQTKWAFAGYFILVVFLLILFRRIILQREKMRQKIELERIEAKKQHEVDLMKIDFFTNISHELKTPLTLIISPLEKMMKQVSHNGLQMQLNLMYKNSKRLLRLINQLLDFRRLESGKIVFEPAVHDVMRIAKEVSDSFSFEAGERKIKFHIESKENSLPAWIDAEKFDKILYNLISNAFKFTSDGGKITVHISKNDLTDWIEISVEDTGTGIAAEDVGKIFNRFFRGETSRYAKGSGIGLSITKELVDIHNGEITVTSQPGKGSKFTVRIPAGKDQVEKYAVINTDTPEEVWNPEIIPEPIHAVSKEMQISEDPENMPFMLIVEDNPDLKLLIKHEFSGQYRILEASDGIMAYKKAIIEIPDIIISDIIMPAMDGIELCRKIKTDERTCHIPVILLTAKSSEEQITTGYEEGADDYITKPFSIAVLKARVKNLIQSRRFLRQQFSMITEKPVQQITSTTLDKKFMDKLFLIIEQNIANADFDASHFAHEIGMSRSQLYRKVHALTNCSVNELIRNYRLKKAAGLLLTNNHNVTETTYSVGFNNVSYFIRCFTAYYGVSPSKYSGSSVSSR